MKMSAVIIASGRATRLGEICSHAPKCLLKFDGVPFLRHLVYWLLKNNISDIIVTGNKASHAYLIEEEIKNNFPPSVSLVIEDSSKSTAHSSYVGMCRARHKNSLVLSNHLWHFLI